MPVMEDTEDGCTLKTLLKEILEANFPSLMSRLIKTMLIIGLPLQTYYHLKVLKRHISNGDVMILIHHVILLNTSKR